MQSKYMLQSFPVSIVPRVDNFVAAWGDQSHLKRNMHKELATRTRETETEKRRRKRTTKTISDKSSNAVLGLI